MPHMVMSTLPPKGNAGGAVSRRKLRGANKVDKILTVNYMYVGEPKKKCVFYVRERLTYRSNVEVTFNEVFDFLVLACGGDSSISLHYTVNTQYVSITTTGQLHTFLAHVHTDPNMFLYIENNDYVWNVKPKRRSGQKKKRDAACETDAVGKEVKKCGCGHSHCDVVDSDVSSCSDEESCDSADYDEDDEEVESGEDAVEEEPYSGGSTCSSEEYGNDEVAKDGTVTEGSSPMPDDVNPIRAGLDAAFTDAVDIAKTMKKVAQELSRRYDARQNSKNGGVGNGGTNRSDDARSLGEDVDIEKQVRDQHKVKREKKERGNESLDIYIKDTLRSDLPRDNPEKSFAGYDRQEVANKMARKLISDAWSTFTQINRETMVYMFEKCVTTLAIKVEESIKEFFPMVADVEDEEKFIKFAKEVKRYTEIAVIQAECGEKMCLQLEMLREVGAFSQEFGHDLKTLQSRVDLRLMLISVKEVARFAEKTFVDDLFLECSCPKHFQRFELGLDELLTELDDIIADKDVVLQKERVFLWTTKVAVEADTFILAICEKHCLWLRVYRKTRAAEMAAQTRRMQKLNNMESAKTKAAAANAAGSSETSTSSTMTPLTPTASPPQKIKKKSVLTPEMKKQIEDMMKSSHAFVYPPLPKAGAILIPIGGLAKCKCSKDCKFFVNEPAYEYMERFNEPRQAVWEKTKQKRFKKN